MKAEKTRKFIDSFIIEEGTKSPFERLNSVPSYKETLRMYHEMNTELKQLESDSEAHNSPETQRKLKLADMIEWAVDNEVCFIGIEDGLGLHLVKLDIEYLEKLYSERGGK